MKDKQNYVKDSSQKRKNIRREIKSALEELFNKHSEYETQQQIKTELKNMGIEATQPTISRALAELGIERNSSGKWARSERDEKLLQLEKTFKYCGGSARLPRLLSNVDVVILRTMPDFNTVIAKQISEAFPKEVLCTICPDNKNIIIYYKLRKKETEDNEVEHTDENSSSSIYKTSRMRVELVKLCKKYRKGTKSDEKPKEQ